MTRAAGIDCGTSSIRLLVVDVDSTGGLVDIERRMEIVRLGQGGTPGPFLIVDIGGGSTEFVLGTTSVVAGVSLDVGSVRLTERHLHDDPPTWPSR